MGGVGANLNEPPGLCLEAILHIDIVDIVDMKSQSTDFCVISCPKLEDSTKSVLVVFSIF